MNVSANISSIVSSVSINVRKQLQTLGESQQEAEEPYVSRVKAWTLTRSCLSARSSLPPSQPARPSLFPAKQYQMLLQDAHWQKAELMSRPEEDSGYILC